LDNDGRADILIDGRFFFHVLRGTGDGHFEYQNDAWGKITHTAEGSVDGGFAFGDIDGDGDLDLMGFTSGDPNRQVELYRNDLPTKHWINIRPVGLPGNKPALNSQIRIFEAGTDKLLWYEEVLGFSKQAQQNYYSFDQLERHYGLGDKTMVDVTITFYPAGTTVRKNGAMADSTIVIGEDGTNGVVEPPKPQPVDPGGGAGVGGSARGGAATGGVSTGGVATAGAETAPGGSAPAGTGTSSGASPNGDSGCGCRIGPSEREHTPIWTALALLGVVLAKLQLRHDRQMIRRGCGQAGSDHVSGNYG
jgi:hypothetical protein